MGKNFKTSTAYAALICAMTGMPLTAAAQAIAPSAPVQQDRDASSETSPQGTGAGPAETGVEDIVVTGSRIPRNRLTTTSPVVSTTADDIALQQALTVEDFSTKLPQLAGGVRQASQGSDAFGAQVLDLRNFGQSRSLVLIDGTRAVPFSFRNSVDINSIPASLIERVDVLTGGAAAVYGADAVAGVVNFVLRKDFEGSRLSAIGRVSEGGGAEYGGSATFGTDLGDRGHIVVALDYTKRDGITVGDRDWARTPNSTIPSVGGVFTDVASGRVFGFDQSGDFTTSPDATSNISDTYPLVTPLKRINGAALFHYDLVPTVTAYGRILYTNTRTTESGTPGPTPPSVNQVVSINQDNPFLTPQIRDQLTFVDGTAQVNVNRSLAELGLNSYNTERNTSQFQLGFKGPLTDNIDWNTYAQYGRSTENSVINGDGLVTDSAGNNNFANIANTIDIFGPNADGLAAALGSPINGFNRKRDQLVLSGTLSGTLEGAFTLPAGPVGFALGVEYRRETADISQDSALLTGNTYRQGVQAAFDGKTEVKVAYGEVLIPILADKRFFKKLDIGGAARVSDYNRFGAPVTWKAEANWAIDDNIRFRGTIQRVIRAPNFGEFAASTSSLPFNALITVPRLTPRYGGDPCVIGTGDTEQCARFGAPAQGSTDSFSPDYLNGRYFYGGNQDIQPETGYTKTVGAVLTPTFAPGLQLTVDYYELKLDGAIGVIQPINAINNCYITDPRADNPLCDLVSRDPNTGQFQDAFVNNQNLGSLKQQGLDIGGSYTLHAGWLPGSGVRFTYQGNIVTSYILQSNPTVQAIQCKGTYGAVCSSDATTLVQPDYRHNASASFLYGKGDVRLDWTHIGPVTNSDPSSDDKLPAQDYFSLNASYEALDWLKIRAGIHNIFDKTPPYVASGGVFNTFPDTYDVLGRTYSVSLTSKF